jgi:membrane-associated protein
MMPNPIDFILNVDKYLEIIINKFGAGVYIVIFAIIFLETGLVITPFLPGDSLLFIAGAFAGAGSLNLVFLLIILSLAAIIGDSLNYWIGNYFGERVFSNNKFFKKEHLEKTKDFYKKHGGKTIIMARFVPIVRTFAPFVAGIGKMNYIRFLSFNVIGGILWIFTFVFAGYYFGKIPIIEKNLTLVILIIIFISVIPITLEYFKQKRKIK